MRIFAPAAVFLVVFAPLSGQAGPVPDSSSASRVQPQSEVSDLARAAAFGPTTPQARANRLALSERKLAERSSDGSTSLSGATIVLRRGYTPAELGAFAELNSLEITRVDITAPSYDGSGALPTMSIGSEQLLRLPGTLSDRVERSIARFRAQMYVASTRTSGAVSKQFLDTAVSQDIYVYKITCVSAATNLITASRHADVSLVLADEDDSALQGYLFIKQRISSEPNGGVYTIVRTDSSQGPPVYVPGVPANVPVRDPLRLDTVTPPGKLRARALSQPEGAK